jgi:hypothetical protein
MKSPSILSGLVDGSGSSFPDEYWEASKKFKNDVKATNI